MQHLQMEFSFDNTPEIIDPVLHLHKRLDEMNESNRKVRKKMFMELGVLRKLCFTLKRTTEHLQSVVDEFTGKKNDWMYLQNDCLFSIHESSDS